MALMKFKDTGTILMGIYCGTTDYLLPYMFKPEFFMLEDGTYSVFSKEHECSGCCYENGYIVEIPPYTCDDVSDVEIWSDYGGTFWWNGKAVEKYGYILQEYRCPFDTDESIGLHDNTPEWVTEFLDELNR